MLPFTKRPGRDESEDNDVVTKDDLITAETRTPASLREGRGKFASINDEEMTTLMPTKTIGDAVAAAKAAQIASPRPAAGAPPPSHAVPSSRAGAGTVPPSPASRSGKFAAQEDEEEDGRTVVRGAPKIVKRSSATSPPNSARGAKMGGMNTMPTTISPAAVIKATLESARAGVKPRTDRLMAGPPQDLLEDLADMQVHPSDVGSEHTAILKSPNSSNVPPPMIQGVRALSTQAMQPQAMPHGTIPPGSSRPLTGPPPPNSNQSGGYAAQYNGPVPSGSVSVPGVSMSQSMPAHFMVPHAPYSDARIDPPGTAVTSRMKVAGRPATSWAMALAAFGIFVGVGAAAVLNGNDGMKETSASFVDPSRAAGGPGARNAAGAQPAMPGAPTAVPVVGANDQPATVGVPPVAVPAATEAAAAPVVTTRAPAVPAATVPPAGMLAAAPAPVAAPPARLAVVAAAAPRAAAPAAAPRAPRPAPQAAAAADDAPVAAAPAAKSGKGGKGAAKPGGDMDDETKKALDELQKAQLERSF